MSKKVHLLCSAACLMSSATVAMAQEVAAQDPVSEAAAEAEIVVTAQKREQNVQDIGVSVTALGSESLAALGRQDVSALAGQVPSLQVNQFSPSVIAFNIRGVSQNDFADSQEAPIAFYSDEVYISALGAISGMTFDLERVEVLRGPQGTLFGRNATGGLVQILSARPTRDFEGFLTATVGSYGQFATEGAISGPLSNHIRGRLSFTTNHGGDYIRNRIGPDYGGAKFYAGRAQIAADVGDNGTLNLKAQVLRNDSDRQASLFSHAAAKPNSLGLGEFVPRDQNLWGNCNGCDAFGYVEPDDNPFTQSADAPIYFNRTHWDLMARYEHDLGGSTTLTSITDYQHLMKKYGDNSDTTPLNLFHYTTDQKLSQLSQELRLVGDSGPLHWLVGGYGIRIRNTNNYNTDARGAFGLNAVYGGKLRTDSLAVFSQLEYKLSDQFTVIGGLRYSWDWKEYDFTHLANGVPAVVFNTATFPNLARNNFDSYSGKIELDFKPSRDVLIYATVNRGIKSGGFGTPAIPPIDPTLIPFGGEILTSYEGGVKLTMFGRTTHLNLSAFYYDYKDYQSFENIGLSLVVRNKQAYLKGLEVEFNSRPVNGMFLQASMTVLDTKVKNVSLPSGVVLDRQMPQAPKLSLTGLARYEFPVGPGKLAVQTNWKYNSTQYFSSFNAPVDRQKRYVVGDARVSYELDSAPIEVAFFVNNLTDTRYLIYNLDLSSALGISQQGFGRPRWFGGSLTARFR
ncbi:TonB-dependent receptor [Sphingomonas koreensis]